MKNNRVSKQGRNLDSPDKRERLLAAADWAREENSKASPEELKGLEKSVRAVWGKNNKK